MLLSFLSINRRYILLTLYLLVSFFLMIINSSTAMQNIKSFFFGTFSYVNVVFNETHDFATEFWYSIKNVKELKTELQSAYEKIQLLQDASIEIEKLKKENNRLKELLSYQKQIDFRTIPAEIIAKDPKYYFNTFIVNKGRADGIEIHMPVIAFQDGQSGVVGKVIETGMHASKIMLLTDKNCYIAAMLYDSGYTGLTKGNGSLEQYLNLLYLDREAMINFGDTVVTSGQGGVFPKGIIIGQVVNVQDAKYGFYYNEIKIRPVIKFSRLDSVFIILKPASREVRTLLREGS